jgi:serine phosphatase RsbU (regulator of sigma subunit)
MEQFIGDAFVLFKPRNVVSGDFFWHGKLGDHKIIVAADCTGHGVPGAFMSLIGSSALDKIVHDYKMSMPDTILRQLHLEILKLLGKETRTSNLGMDASICTLCPEKNEFYFAGAHNGLIIKKVGAQEVEEIKPDRKGLGDISKSGIQPSEFTRHTFSMDEVEHFFMFSDGFKDQFGGPDNRKLMARGFRNLLSEGASKPIEEQRAFYNDHFEEWKGEDVQTDDVLLIGVKL